MKRLICLLFGHDWRILEAKVINVGMISNWPVRVFKCNRCGKIKEEIQ